MHGQKVKRERVSSLSEIKSLFKSPIVTKKLRGHLDTATLPSQTLGPLISNGYSHTTKEETRLSRTPHYAAKQVIARENLREVKEQSSTFI